MNLPWIYPGDSECDSRGQLLRLIPSPKKESVNRIHFEPDYVDSYCLTNNSTFLGRICFYQTV